MVKSFLSAMLGILLIPVLLASGIALVFWPMIVGALLHRGMVGMVVNLFWLICMIAWDMARAEHGKGF